MPNQFHILNGDALLEQFPENIEGPKYIIRECLLEGRLEGERLEEFFENRAKFIENFFEKEKGKYDKISVSEFNKILSIPEDNEVNLWFEDDLYCQVNFWFSVFLLTLDHKNHNIFLVRPNAGNEYNFGRMSEIELTKAFKERFVLNTDEIDSIAGLWKSYQINDRKELMKKGMILKNKLPFILPAIEAHIARFPEDGSTGRPVHSLNQIILDLNTIDFEPVFNEFCKRETIYGFSDLQVKKMLDEIIDIQ